MVRQAGNTLINNKSWAQIVMGSGVQQKLQQDNLQSKKIQQNKNQKKQTQSQRANTQQLKQVKQYLDKTNSSVKQNKNYIKTTQYPRSISSTQLQALQQEFAGLCNLFNANNYFGRSIYSQKKAWLQTKGRNVISVASCYSLRHKPVQNLIRPQQKRVIKNGMRFTSKQNKSKNMGKNQKKNQSMSQQPRWGESKQSNWGAQKAWGKNQPKQIREPPREQAQKQQQMRQQQQQMEKIQQRHKKQMELLQKAQLKQQELLLKKQTEQRKKLLQYQKQQKLRVKSQSQPVQRQAPKKAQAPMKQVVRNVSSKQQVRARPLRHRLEAVRKQNQSVGADNFKYTLNQLVDAFNYFPKKSYSGDRAWQYNKFLGGFNSTASYYAQKNAPFVSSNRPKINVTNGNPIYTFNVKPTTKSVIKPYNSNLQGIRTEGNGKYFKHWYIGSIWTHYYSKPKSRRV
jgi:hypothetical protein